jgi:glyoxylase-like metal-dependent hydrolase (beta-lactamase superfamily II)
VNTVPAAPSIGRPQDPAAVRSLSFDDVVATYVVDGVLRMRPEALFPETPVEFWSQVISPAGDLVMSAGALLVEVADATVLIDAGVGAMTTEISLGSIDCGSMLDVLDGLGVGAGEIDVLALTHLHFDHAGWAFADGARTFPHARYVVAAREWAPYATGESGDEPLMPSHVIAGLASERTRVEFFDDGDDIVPGVRALVTPGHTPGHTSYVITSRTGRRLIVFGDAFHTQAQVTHPGLLSAVDSDGDGVTAARRLLLSHLSEPDTLGFGFHFGDQPFGRVIVDAAGEPSWAPVPSVVLAPPPR